MGMPSYLADIEDKAADNRTLAGLFKDGTAGAAGISNFLEAQRATTALKKAREAEAQARKREEQARSYADDMLAWRAATADVKPLRRR